MESENSLVESSQRGPTRNEKDNYRSETKSKLNKDNLSQLSKQNSQLKAKKSKAKPAWAITPKMEEEAKEKEVDELIEFAFDLDYEKYMEDYEVRQAIEIIKDRVDEIKQDEDWKENAEKGMMKSKRDRREADAQSQAESVYSYSKQNSNFFWPILFNIFWECIGKVMMQPL